MPQIEQCNNNGYEYVLYNLIVQLVDIRKASIFLMTVIMASFLYQPVNAHIHVHTSLYQPDIYYLGRRIHLELGAFPSKSTDLTSQHIYALVHDRYGNITYGNLSYRIDNNKNYSKPILMKLINGVPSNGTWAGEIPRLKVNMPYTVQYRVFFKDNLDYNVTKSGPYYNHADYTGHDENIAEGKGYEVADRYILFNLKNAVDGRPEVIAVVSNNSNKIESVDFIYRSDDGAWNSILMKPHLRYYNDTIYSAIVPKVPPYILPKYFFMLHDSKLLYVAEYRQSVMNSIPTKEDNIISVATSILNIAINNDTRPTANVEIDLRGSAINNAYWNISSAQRQNTIGNPENLNLQIKDMANNDSTIQNVSGSFHNLTQSISLLGFSHLGATIGGNRSDLKPYLASLTGHPKAFPLDHYFVDLKMIIPFQGIKVHPNKPTYGDLFNSEWKPDMNYSIPDNYTIQECSTHKTDFMCLLSNKTDPPTDVKIQMGFHRNDFAVWTMTFPILFIFFLLGAICFLEPKGHYLVARIAITLGVFAFVFTFDAVLASVKPHNILNTSTFADFLLKLVLVAAIASTIGSVVGNRLVTRGQDDETNQRKNKEEKKWYQKYSVYDLLAIVLVAYMIINESESYSVTEQVLYLYQIIIIAGLAWGFLSRILYYQIINIKTRRYVRTISSQIDDLKAQNNKADLSNGLRNLFDRSNRKTSWSELYVGDSTIKVEIIHINHGKFIISDDRDVGKYVGKIVNASQLKLSLDVAKEQL